MEIVIQNGNLDLFKCIVGDLNEEQLFNALYFAVKYKQQNIVDFLLEYGVNINLHPNEDDCILEEAVLNNDLPMLKHLVSFGAQPSAKLSYDCLCVAIDNNYQDIVEYLVHEVIKPVINHIYVAAREDNECIVKYLFDYQLGLPLNELLEIIYLICSYVNIDLIKYVMQTFENLHSLNTINWEDMFISRMSNIHSESHEYLFELVEKHSPNTIYETFALRY